MSQRNRRRGALTATLPLTYAVTAGVVLLFVWQLRRLSQAGQSQHLDAAAVTTVSSLKTEAQLARVSAAPGENGSLASLGNNGHGRQRDAAQRESLAVKRAHPLWWWAPIWTGDGYGTEAVSYVMGILRDGTTDTSQVWVQQSGNTKSHSFLNSMDRDTRKALRKCELLPERLAMQGKRPPSIVVCHSFPQCWQLPNITTGYMDSPGCPCPSQEALQQGEVAYRVGRTMFEIDRVPEYFVKACASMDEVWVPSQFNVDTFAASGVPRDKLHVLPEGIDTTVWDPHRYTPLNISTLSLKAATGCGEWPAFAPPAVDRRRYRFNRLRRRQPHAYDSDGDSGADVGDSTSGAATAELAAAAQLAAPAGLAAGAELSDSVSGEAAGLTSAVPVQAVQGRLKRTPQSFILGPQPTLPSPGLGEAGFSSPGLDNTGLSSPGLDNTGLSSPGSDKTASVSSPGHQSLARSLLAGAPAGPDAGAVREGVANSASEEEQEAARTSTLFLSVFKWEVRKGWDVLVDAFVGEFTPSDNATLLIVTRPTSGNYQDFEAQVAARAARVKPHADTCGMPRILIMRERVPDSDFPSLYLSADALVIPTRGEGWGRPQMEAMAMGLPVITTNWSGVTAFATPETAYLIDVESLVPTKAVPSGPGGALKGEIPPFFTDADGSRWAQPSVAHLQQLMRRVMTHPQEADAIGEAARRRIQEHFTERHAAATVAAHWDRIERKLSGQAA